jgi:hypothetical protein
MVTLRVLNAAMPCLMIFKNVQHPTYTFEEPNSLTVEELPEFLRRTRDSFPGHYAMKLLGFSLGKRPSTTRPLPRKGPALDVLWDAGLLLFHRSNMGKS